MIIAKINKTKIIVAEINTALVYKNKIVIIELYIVSYNLITNYTI